jgi:hypothetical protein
MDRWRDLVFFWSKGFILDFPKIFVPHARDMRHNKPSTTIKVKDVAN